MIDKIFDGFYKVLFVLAVFVSFYYFGVSFSLLVSLAFIFLLFVQKALQRILSSGISLFAPFVLNAAKTSVLTQYEYKPLLNTINGIFTKYNINYSLTKDMVDTVLVYGLLFVIASILFREDNTTIGKITPGGNDEFKDKTFIERQDGFCKFLIQKLESMNRQQNWNNELYVPIETEVELTKGHKLKRYDDLLKCLKKNKSRVPVFIKYWIKKINNSRAGKWKIVNKIINFFEDRIGDNTVYLILGDPGSGKSVSLRKLCSELLRETHVTGKLPVYISLQTWAPETGEWSKKNLPSKIDLINYIKTELYKDGDLFTNSFLDDYFEKMLEDGRFYFIFDSFDEMPCLMGGDENGELITGISELFHQFLTNPDQNGGIIASRLYNRPSNDFLNQTYTLRLQKFNNARVRKMLKRYLPADANDTILRLFKDRIDLVELCRNPFHLSLLIDYLKENEQGFPDNQFELFKHFVESRLEKSKSRIIEDGFTSKEIYEAASDLSVMMQKNSNYGLDFPIDRIFISGKRFDKERWEKCISLFTYMKICRTGGNHQTVSFVHRRFQEFFFVEAIIKGVEKITDKTLAGILDNTGMRDALVLYCQIAEEDRIRGIIDFCCGTIKDNIDKLSEVLNEGSVKLINSLYFLIESFSNRKTILHDDIETIKNLRAYIKREIHYVVLVAIVNSISLLEPEDIQQLILDVFRINNRWLKSLMVSKCQLIEKLDRRIEIGFCHYFEKTKLPDLVHNFNNVDFSLSLSGCFAYIRRIHIFLMGSIVVKLLLSLFFLSYFIIMLWGYLSQNVDIIVRLLGDTLYRLQLNYMVNPIDTSRLIIEEKTWTDERSLMAIVLFVFIVLIKIVEFSEKLSYKDIGYSINSKENQNQKSVLKKGVTYYSPSIDHDKYIILFIIVVLFCPNGLFLHLAVVMEFYIALYFLYRVIHEILKPIIKNRNNIFDLRWLIKKLPFFVVENIKEIIELLIVASVGIGVVVIIGFVLIGGLYIVATYICSLIDNKITVGELGGIIIVVLILAFILFLIVMRVKDVIIFYRLSHNKLKKKDRGALLEDLKIIFYLSVKRKYVKRLMDYGVELYGEWPEHYINSIGDDVLIRDLAIWDSKDSTIKNSYIDVI